MINHFELFAYGKCGGAVPYTEIGFQAHLLYRWVRHPIMLDPSSRSGRRP